jgi:hypothetical protein
MEVEGASEALSSAGEQPCPFGGLEESVGAGVAFFRRLMKKTGQAHANSDIS